MERAAEAFEAEVGVAIRDGAVLTAVGFPRGKVPEADLVALARDAPEQADCLGVGPCSLALAEVEGWRDGGILLARAGDDGFSVQERSLLRAMTRVLGLTLEMVERQRLLAQLSRIQRSISHRAPLQEVLDSVTAGAAELLGVEVVGLRLLDPDDPSFAILASSSGMDEEMVAEVYRIRAHEGVAGRAAQENRLITVDDYKEEPGSLKAFAERDLRTAMAAPVHEDGRVAGSLVVASYQAGRRFTESEQEALRAFAEHTSLALTDAKTVEAMREAQRSKDMFLAMVSHELKTPLTVIMGALRTLEIHGQDLPPELVKELLTAGWNRGKELERLINRLLQGARAELAGAEEQVFLPQLLADAVNGFEHARRVTLADPPQVVLRLDRPAALEVLGILLENAISHSAEDGEVAIETHLRDGELRVSVSNPGSLSPDLDTDTLFQPFQRGAAARSPGVGLGLYIAGRVAASVGGQIEVSSGAGRVCFVLRLLVEEVGPEAQSQAQSEQSQVS